MKVSDFLRLRTLSALTQSNTSGGMFTSSALLSPGYVVMNSMSLSVEMEET